MSEAHRSQPEGTASRTDLTLTEASQISCFVVMPSGNHGEYPGGKEESDFIYHEIITPAAKAALGPEVVMIRETDATETGAIDKSIVRKIVHSEYAVVDVTGQNPNVLFELGMRYVFRNSKTILIRQDGTDIPFDITTYRHVTYRPRFRGINQSVEDISGALKYAKEGGSVDSLVYDTFPNLRVDIPESSDDGSRFRRRRLWEGIMPWYDYWRQVDTIVDLLSDKIEGGLYRPDALIGLSNGGMMVADLLGRKLFRGTPVVSLWANRWDEKGLYFENDVNLSMIDGIIKFLVI